MKKKKIKLCLISSSGGHFEELLAVKKICEKYESFFVTEFVKEKNAAKYYLIRDRGNKLQSFMIMFINIFKSFFIFLKERPTVIITTGTAAALGMVLVAKLFRKKVVFIESFCRVYDSTRFGRFIYKHKLADLVIYQWQTLKDIYPKGVYGGGVF